MSNDKGNRWRILVELTWDVTEDDIRKLYPDDAEIDFGNRALRRVRHVLDEAIGEGKFDGYHISARPKRVLDF